MSDSAPPHAPYARARETSGNEELYRELWNMGPHEFVSTASKLTSAVKRLRWRQFVALRSATIARAVRLCEKALGEAFVSRTKEGSAWVFRARCGEDVLPALRVQWAPLRDLQKATPVEVVVLIPEVVNVEVFATKKVSEAG